MKRTVYITKHVVKAYRVVLAGIESFVLAETASKAKASVARCALAAGYDRVWQRITSCHRYPAYDDLHLKTHTAYGREYIDRYVAQKTGGE